MLLEWHYYEFILISPSFPSDSILCPSAPPDVLPQTQATIRSRAPCCSPCRFCCASRPSTMWSSSKSASSTGSCSSPISTTRRSCRPHRPHWYRYTSISPAPYYFDCVFILACLHRAFSDSSLYVIHLERYVYSSVPCCLLNVTASLSVSRSFAYHFFHRCLLSAFSFCFLSLTSLLFCLLFLSLLFALVSDARPHGTAPAQRTHAHVRAFVVATASRARRAHGQTRRGARGRGRYAFAVCGDIYCVR